MISLVSRVVMPLALAAVFLLVVLAGAVGDATQAPVPLERVAAFKPPKLPKPPKKPHVVLLIMDELPSDSLLDRRGRIDPVRYPNFAALAGDSTWFRNGYSIYDSTTKAVPLILDGKWPSYGSSPDRAGHPRSIFDMFKRRGYRMVASEEASALCPPGMCRGGPAAPPRNPPRSAPPASPPPATTSSATCSSSAIPTGCSGGSSGGCSARTSTTRR